MSDITITRKNYEMLKLKNQLCFPLYAAAKDVVAKYTPFLDEIGLTYTQYIAMMVLWEQGEVGVSELGGYLYLDSNTLTPLLKRLEAKGLVRRERAADGDERAVRITLTQAGAQLREQAAEIPAKIGACLPLAKEEAETLYWLLYKLLGN
ncbi:MAG: MarR family transcriptional regulator [Oscillospiraceae bacterium]|jgi:DNA-binding MarR family transcriptional regulator|nr:MarR family transcriptional regulator [Oscillospiraceae bacterium]